jgi:hypothetical protein
VIVLTTTVGWISQANITEADAATDYPCTRLDPSGRDQRSGISLDVVVGPRTLLLTPSTPRYTASSLSELAPGTPLSVWVIAYGLGNPDYARDAGAGTILIDYPNFPVSVTVGGVTVSGLTSTRYSYAGTTANLAVPATPGPQSLQVSFDTPLNGFSCRVNGSQSIEFVTPQPASSTTAAPPAAAPQSTATKPSKLTIADASTASLRVAKVEYKAKRPQVRKCRRINEFTLTCRVDWTSKSGSWTITVRVWNAKDGKTYYKRTK